VSILPSGWLQVPACGPIAGGRVNYDMARDMDTGELVFLLPAEDVEVRIPAGMQRVADIMEQVTGAVLRARIRRRQAQLLPAGRHEARNFSAGGPAA
jgi:hypothetical protein